MFDFGGMMPASFDERFGAGMDIWNPQPDVLGLRLSPPIPPQLAGPMGTGGEVPGLALDDLSMMKTMNETPAPVQGGAGGSLIAGLRGLQAPVAPTAQKVSTPAAPRQPVGVPKGGQLLALLEMMRGSGGAPPNLGALLGRR